MADYKQGTKKEVAEIKFLIHDLRVERFMNELVHFHVTLDADLEIHEVEQAQVLHAEDLKELRRQAVSLRKAMRDYSNAVKSFSPDKTILVTGKRYIHKVLEISELILNPLWGRIDKVLSFLPEDSRSVRSRSHYRNCVRWIAGVHSRIEHFLDELKDRGQAENFDLATEIELFTRNVLTGYVLEKSRGRVELRMDRLDPAVAHGNRYRFRRMFFNLVMNAVDAMMGMPVGVINISDTIEKGRCVVRVRDNGSGMPPEKISQLMADRDSLDGELHSLGFVFVRQTVADFEGEIEIDSEPGKGTTITVRLPFLAEANPADYASEGWKEYDLLQEVDRVPGRARPAGAPDAPAHGPKPAPPAVDQSKACGQMILEDYRRSDAPFPGCIFAIAVSEEGRTEFFTHRPYERYYNISHEDLSPMFFEATVRGRLEEDEEKTPVLILKSPQNVRDYFDLKEVPEAERSRENFSRMVRDEYVRIARTLIATGLQADIGVHLAEADKFFSGTRELLEVEPFPLERLAHQKLTVEM